MNTSMAWGIGFGVAVGLALGVLLLDNIAVGIAIGIGIGVACGLAFQSEGGRGGPRDAEGGTGTNDTGGADGA